MNRERLEWVISGLNHYKLTEREGQFVKSAEEDFNLNNTLTELQEEKLEIIYKEKSKLIPDKTASSPKPAITPAKTRFKRPRVRVLS